jgi:hypothetical protein
MPTWSLEEVTASKIPPSDGYTVKEAFDKVGGVPRHFQNVDDVVRVRQEIIRGRVPQAQDFPTVAESSKVFKMDPLTTVAANGYVTWDYSSYTLDFLCDGAKADWFESKQADSAERLRHVAREAIARGIGNSAVKVVFEQYALAYLEVESSPSTAKPLVVPLTALGNLTKTIILPSDPVTLTLPPSRQKTTFPGDGFPTLHHNTIYVPESSNFPFVDFMYVEAVANTAWLFQITMSAIHRKPLDVSDNVLQAVKAQNYTAKVVYVAFVNKTSRMGVTSLQSAEGKSGNGLLEDVEQYIWTFTIV